MTIGSGIYNPNGAFAFPRSYIRGLTINVDVSLPPVQTDNMFRFTNPSLPNQRFTIVIEPRFYNWSSNAYTLDFVIAESYYQNLPDPTELPMPFALSYFQFPGNKSPMLNFQPFALSFVDFWPFDFPSGEGGYWRPPFPNLSQ